jgi:hypothetical protein
MILALFLAAIAVPPADLEESAKIDREMVAFNPKYVELDRKHKSIVRELERQVLARETAGESTACSHQILTELDWLAGDTADFARADRRIADLTAVLADPAREKMALQQDKDGSWGACHDEWFFKLDASYDHLSKEERFPQPKLPYRFLDRVNSPEKLRAYFDALWQSDVARTGVDNRRAFNESMSNLLRLIIHNQPSTYQWHPRLKETLLDFVLHRYRSPETGFWGTTYVRNGRTEFVDDLSITFHIVSYLKGDVPDLNKMVNTLLAVKDLAYPVGWLRGRGGYSNHHNMDVAVLLRYGWPFLNDSQKQDVAAELHKMLRWCLTQSLQPDGSFRTEAGEDSIEEQTYFGVAFLARIGYFDPSRRFWTTEDFPDAESRRQAILAFIAKHRASGGAGGGYYQDALDELRIKAR